MLVYIRKEEVPTILSDVTPDKIPVSLSQRFTDEREIENIKRKEKNEAHLYVSVTVITDEQFNGHQGKVRVVRYGLGIIGPWYWTGQRVY